MPAVQGPRFLADPQGEASRFADDLQAAVADASTSPRYVFKSDYWCEVKNGTWPNVTGWAESREAQRIYTPILARLTAAGVPADEARRQASEQAKAEMLARTTERKEASARSHG